MGSGIIKFLRVFVCIVVLMGMEVQAMPYQLSASHSEYQPEMLGNWRVRTQVVWSDCPYVSVGDTADSLIQIDEVNGRLFPHWMANDWQLVRNKRINIKNNKTLSWERENKLYKNGKYWFVEAKDQFDLQDADEAEGQSIVRQYLNGKYVGSYSTSSKLYKI